MFEPLTEDSCDESCTHCYSYNFGGKFILPLTGNTLSKSVILGGGKWRLY